MTKQYSFKLPLRELIDMSYKVRLPDGEVEWLTSLATALKVYDDKQGIELAEWCEYSTGGQTTRIIKTTKINERRKLVNLIRFARLR